MAKSKSFNTDKATMELLGGNTVIDEQPQVVETTKTTTINTNGLVFEPKVEAKSRRVQLIFQPSFYKEIQKRAKSLGVSVNAYINALAKQDIMNIK